MRHKTAEADNRAEMEKKLRNMAEALPEADFELKISPVMTDRKKKSAPLVWATRAAVFVLLFSIAGSVTVFAASPSFRERIIHFFTNHVTEEIPLGKVEDSESTEEENEVYSPITVGNVTLLQNRKLDEHFTASYLSSPDYMDMVWTPSGKLLFYSQNEESGQRTYYRIENGSLESVSPKTCQATGSVLLQKLPGIMENGKNLDVNLPEMTFTAEWQQYGEEIIVINDNRRRFDIGETFGGTVDGKTMVGEYDGEFYTSAFPGDSEWIQVYFAFDAQRTDYQYPFLFNVVTGETQDPIADADLSKYACVTELTISDDKKTATAMAGADPDHQKEITIDLQSGSITEKQEPASPVLDCYISFATSDHTVFYATGTDESMSGYLYDSDSDETTELFQDIAWGRMWANVDEAVALIGGNYAAHYNYKENKAYLLNLEDGSEMLLEGVPTDSAVNFFWNEEKTVLSISFLSVDGNTKRLAFFIPGADHAWYFDRADNENVQEIMACWYGEYGYLIQGSSQEEEEWYLFLYEYTP
jgi:hypothetical protein